MLQMILTLLKIIGIVVVAVLGMLLFVLLVVLLTPICLEIRADFPGAKEHIMIKTEFSWLFHLLAGKAVFENGKFHWDMRVAWRHLEQKKTEKNSKTEEKVSKERFSNAKEKEENLKQSAGKALGRRQKAKYTFQKISVEIKNILTGKKVISTFFEDPVHKQALAQIKKEKKWIFQSVKMKVFSLRLHYGFDDPFRTGQVLAALSIIYPFVGDNMVVQPEFEQEIFEGELYVKGRWRLLFPTIYGIKMISDSSVRRTFVDVKDFKFE